MVLALADADLEFTNEHAEIPNFFLKLLLVGGWATPLKNISQLG